jgi:hypothetical protein
MMQVPEQAEDLEVGPDDDEDLLSARADEGGIPDLDADAEHRGGQRGADEEPEEAELTKPQVRRIVLEELYKRAGPPIKHGETIGVFHGTLVRDPANDRWVAADKPTKAKTRPKGFTDEFNRPKPELRQQLDRLQGAEELRHFLRAKGMNLPAFLAGRASAAESRAPCVSFQKRGR